MDKQTKVEIKVVVRDAIREARWFSKSRILELENWKVGRVDEGKITNPTER